MHRTVVALLLVGCAGESHPAPRPATSEQCNESCEPGSACDAEGNCRKLCTSDAACGGCDVCREGLCASRACESDAPVPVPVPASVMPSTPRARMANDRLVLEGGLQAWTGYSDGPHFRVQPRQ